MDTLNLTNCREARIQVKQSLCGFVPSTIEITDSRRRKIFLNFVDFECLNPPFPTGGLLWLMILKITLTHKELERLCKMKGLDLSFFFPVLNVPKSTSTHLHIARNPFAVLERLQEPSLAPEKMKKARSQAETDLIAPETEKSSLLGFVNPVKKSCPIGFVGHAKSNFPFKKLIFEGSERE